MSKVILLNRPCEYDREIEDRGDLIFETERAVDVYDILVKEGKFYSVSMKNMTKDIVGVDEVLFNLNPEEESSTEFVCPYCKGIDEDSWELDTKDDNYTCTSCGSDIAYKRTERGFIIKPVFPTSIIKL